MYDLILHTEAGEKVVCLLRVLPALTNNFTYEIYYYIY